MEEAFQQLIDRYVSIVAEDGNKEEIYKWECIQHFQEHWDIESADFYEMFKKAFAKRINLIYQNSYGFLDKLGQVDPEKLRGLFRQLYRSGASFEERLAEHQRASKEYLKYLKKELRRENLNHQQDERTVAFMLVLRYPEDFILYKANIYAELCKFLQVEKRLAGKCYAHMEALFQSLRGELRNHPNLQTAAAGFITDGLNWKDNDRLLFQDIAFRVLIQSKKQERKMAFIEDLAEAIHDQLEEEGHPLTTHRWNDKHSNSWWWISALPDNDGRIKSTYHLHYEIVLRNGRIFLELHPEGNQAFKQYFEPFIQKHGRVGYKKVNWMHPANATGFHKLVMRKPAASYNSADKTPSDEQVFNVTEALKDMYRDLHPNIDQFLKSTSVNPIPQTMSQQIPLNQILYGPPGTGKTYNAINHAVSIVENRRLQEVMSQERKIVQEAFEKYKEQGVIEFVTFHQSFTYEDFVEGIKPKLASNELEQTGDEDAQEIAFEVKAGIFKTIAAKARERKEFAETDGNTKIPEIDSFSKNINKVSLGNTHDPNDEGIYAYCIENNCIALGFGEDIDFKGVESRKDIRKKYLEAGIEVKETNDFNVSAIERFILWMEKGQLVFVSHGLRKLKAIGRVTGDYYCDPSAPIRYSQFRKVEWIATDLSIPVYEFMKKQFSQQSIYQLAPKDIDWDFFKKKKKENSPLNHVLIIDEINRGNVSQIFGELITLIEEDKREGEANALSVKLPYSKSDEGFSVPSNLFILGTMNTADRSVEALDTALRRRFSFVEMPPKPLLIKEKGITPDNSGVVDSIDLVHLLKTINHRIEKLLDKDHMIGHSYFMEVDSPEALKLVFADKIIPLLQEYFFGDYGKIGLVLGKDFFENPDSDHKVDDRFFAAFKHEALQDLRDRPVWKLKELDKDFNIVEALRTCLG